MLILIFYSGLSPFSDLIKKKFDFFDLFSKITTFSTFLSTRKKTTTNFTILAKILVITMYTFAILAKFVALPVKSIFSCTINI